MQFMACKSCAPVTRCSVLPLKEIQCKFAIICVCMRLGGYLLSTCTGFKQPVGTLTISGLHALPIFHYGMQRGLLAWLNPLLQPLRLLLVVGRVLCGAVEVRWLLVLARIFTTSSTFQFTVGAHARVNATPLFI